MKYKLSYNIQEELKKENIELCEVSFKELDNLLNLYKDRINWFKEKNINQWQDYFSCHPVDEFTTAIDNRRMFSLKKDNEIIAAFELATESIYWDIDSTEVFYICKVVTKIGYKNICNIIFDICKNIAFENGVKYLRLNCVESNYKLNSIYESYGFELVNTCSDQYHKYNLRQLVL